MFIAIAAPDERLPSSATLPLRVHNVDKGPQLHVQFIIKPLHEGPELHDA